MLQACKYTKFREINFKILAHILLTPKILSIVKADQVLVICHWCGAIDSLEYVLLECPEVVKTRTCFVINNKKTLPKWKTKYWIFSTASAEINQIIWVVSFEIYKAILRALEGYNDNLRILVSSECVHYQGLFLSLLKSSKMSFQKEWTAVQIMLDDIALLDFAAAQCWCDKNIPSSNMSFEDELVPALCMAFGVTE